MNATIIAQEIARENKAIERKEKEVQAHKEKVKFWESQLQQKK